MQFLIICYIILSVGRRTTHYKNFKEEIKMKKDYGYRLQIKVHGKWRHGLVAYATVEEAQARLEEMVKVGHPRKGIRVQPETEIFC